MLSCGLTGKYIHYISSVYYMSCTLYYMSCISVHTDGVSTLHEYITRGVLSGGELHAVSGLARQHHYNMTCSL